jgi:UDP-N-acetylmuramyl pentapeptide synthase
MKDDLFSAYIGVVYGATTKEMAQTYALAAEAGFMDDPDATTGDIVADELIRATVPGVSMRAFLEAVQVHAMMLGVDMEDKKAMLDVASGVSRSMVETARGLQGLLVDRAAANGGPVATALKVSKMMAEAIQSGVRPGDGTIH